MVLQGYDLSKSAEVAKVQDADGDTVTTGYFDPTQDCTFEYVVSGTGIANSKTQAKIPEIGAIVTITVTAGEIGETLTGTKWEVQPSPKITFSNTGFTRITLPLKKHPAITAVAVA